MTLRIVHRPNVGRLVLRGNQILRDNKSCDTYEQVTRFAERVREPGEAIADDLEVDGEDGVADGRTAPNVGDLVIDDTDGGKVIYRIPPPHSFF